MAPPEELRHATAHVLATALQRLHPETKWGTQLKLFRLDTGIGSGLPLSLPRGAAIRAEVDA